MARKRLFKNKNVNWKVLTFSFLLAVLVFIAADFLIQETRTVTIPLEVILPEGFVATSNIPNQVDLKIRGTEDRIYMVDVERIGVSADFSSVMQAGVASVPVRVDLSYYSNILDKAQVSFFTDPAYVRVYFEEAVN